MEGGTDDAFDGADPFDAFEGRREGAVDSLAAVTNDTALAPAGDGAYGAFLMGRLAARADAPKPRVVTH